MNFTWKLRVMKRNQQRCDGEGHHDENVDGIDNEPRDEQPPRDGGEDEEEAAQHAELEQVVDGGVDPAGQALGVEEDVLANLARERQIGSVHPNRRRQAGEADDDQLRPDHLGRLETLCAIKRGTVAGPWGNNYNPTPWSTCDV